MVGPNQQATKRCRRTLSHCSVLSKRDIPDTKTWQKLVPQGPGEGKEGTCSECPYRKHRFDGAAVWAHPPKKVHGGQYFAASQSSHALELDQTLGKLRVLPKLPSGNSRPLLELQEWPAQGLSWSCRNALRPDAVSITQCIISVLCRYEDGAYWAGFSSSYVVSGYMASSFKVSNCLTA